MRAWGLLLMAAGLGVLAGGYVNGIAVSVIGAALYLGSFAPERRP
jgi:F0F1-type ATP synthase membrane subunit c/vacuolar-type H+-ATPase subunit K